MKYKVPIYYLLIFSIISALATYFFFYYLNDNQQKYTALNGDRNTQSCLGYVKRLEGFKYIRPFVYSRKGCESEFLLPLKVELSQIIDNYKKKGDINSASVFIKVFGHGEWICINDSENYRPAALMNIPVLITYLRNEELHSGYLNKTFKSTLQNTITNDKSKSIESGRNYTVKELLHYMIAYSDNNATKLLYDNLDTTLFKRVFSDLEIEAPILPLKENTIEIKDYMIFLEALYNAGYLTIDNSEFAAELLAECDFKTGLVAGLPDTATIAHEVGLEFFNKQNELHDCGIILSGNKKYEIAVMSKGKDAAKLSEFIKTISHITYQRINN